jgi:hypothetical protein
MPRSDSIVSRDRGEGSRGTTAGGQGIDVCGVSSICGAGVPKMWPLAQRFFISSFMNAGYATDRVLAMGFNPT